MSMTSELVQELRRLAKSHCFYGGGCTLEMAANTIEELSAKLATANMERSSAHYNSGWIPVSERLPEDDNYILMSFVNFSLPMVGRYEKSEDGSGAFYLGDCDEDDTCVANGLFVNAWMPLPELYKAE